MQLTHLLTLVRGYLISVDFFFLEKLPAKTKFRTGEKAAQHLNRTTHKVRVESTLFASRLHNARIDSS